MDRDAKNRTALRKERLDRLATAGLVADGPALAPQLLLTNGNNEESLKRAVACYCCKAPFSELHHFYAALCPACASLNFQKRTQTADLRGRGALVTGARVKIGFRVALKLLRAGATVVATSRFPADAAARYASEPDAEQWRKEACALRTCRRSKSSCFSPSRIAAAASETRTSALARKPSIVRLHSVTRRARA